MRAKTKPPGGNLGGSKKVLLRLKYRCRKPVASAWKLGAHQGGNDGH
jgi:hypothetical protein